MIGGLAFFGILGVLLCAYNSWMSLGPAIVAIMCLIGTCITRNPFRGILVGLVLSFLMAYMGNGCGMRIDFPFAR